MTKTKQTRRSTRYHFHAETCNQMAKVPAGTVSAQAQESGIEGAEPLLVGLDCLLRYANAYAKRFDQTVNNDYVLRVPFLEAAKGFRGLLNGDGAVAMGLGVTTDSKDNGACEGVFWAAMKAGGFTEADL